MSVDDLAARVVVRHRAPGHLRFDVPAELCRPAAAAAIERGLRELAGVYRVGFEIPGCKLAIRYDEHVCALRDVAQRLKALLADLPAEEAAPADAATTDAGAASAAASDGEALANRALSQAGATVRMLAQQAAARAQAALAALRAPGAAPDSLQARIQPVIASALTEKAITNFINDIVAFYLIKVHWDLISGRWLKEPLKYRNAWATTFYFVFLLVRYRKQQGAKK